MSKEFVQIVWDDQLQDEWQAILRLAVREDFGEQGDWTTRALIPEDAEGEAAVVARQPGVIAGLPGVEITLQQIEPRLVWSADIADGRLVEAGDRIGLIHGPARGVLMAERLVLNLLGHLSGIATLTRRYVEAVAGTKARIYDTRKTTPAWRRLEKYAVRCGGGRNHRTGLFEAVLIKDNHLAFGASLDVGSCSPGLDDVQATAVSRRQSPFSPGEAVARARRFIENHAPDLGVGSCSPRLDDGQATGVRSEMIVEIEVDRPAQLEEVLAAGPDIVLLDNFSLVELREAVALRDACQAAIELEASGGVDLQTVGRLAATGVERISVGALTHSAACLDIALDWLSAA